MQQRIWLRSQGSVKLVKASVIIAGIFLVRLHFSYFKPKIFSICSIHQIDLKHQILFFLNHLAIGILTEKI